MGDTDVDEILADNVYRFILLVVAGLLIRLGYRLWTVLVPGSWVGAVVEIYVVGTAVALLIFAVVDVDLERWGTPIAAWTSFVVLAAALAIVMLRSEQLWTDVILFSRYATDLLLAGKNPYPASMAPAHEIYNAPTFVTPKIDGTSVSSFSYPAGAIIVFLPEAALGGTRNFMLTLWAFAAVLLALLILESPPQLAPFALLPIMGSRNLIWTATGGSIDLIWIVPLIVSMRYWHAGRLERSAFAFGLAAGSKQLVWPIAPFLAIWLWNDADSLTDLRRDVTTTLSWGWAGFLVLNLPFILWGPKSWATSVLTPIAGGAPLVHQGVGPTLLSVSGLYALPKSYFSLLLVLTLVVGLALYALHWDRAKWAAWIVPPVLFFFNYRSLLSYFTHFMPVAYMALLCALDLRRERWPTLLDAHDVIQEVKSRVAAA